MPIAALALTFGSFGDILETAKLAKRIVDILRNQGHSSERQKMISTLKGMCEDMSWFSTITAPESSPEFQHFRERLLTEVALCRLLLKDLYTTIDPSNLMRRIWRAWSEDKELASWETRLSARRQVLQLLMSALTCLYSAEGRHQLGHVQSQVQHIASEVGNLQESVRNYGTLGWLTSTYLSRQVSRMESHMNLVRRNVDELRESLPRSISEPVFLVLDPVGRAITIQLSHCHNFDDLDRILKAYLHGRPQAGSSYVERGDYNIVSSDGTIIPPRKVPGKLRAGVRFGMSIVQRMRYRIKNASHSCPHCGSDIEIGDWNQCLSPACASIYQVTSEQASLEHEEIYSPEIQTHENTDELFRLVQIIYITQDVITRHFRLGTRVFYWDGDGRTVYGTVRRVVAVAKGTTMVEVRRDDGVMISLPASSLNKA